MITNLSSKDNIFALPTPPRPHSLVWKDQYGFMTGFMSKIDKNKKC
jgi:hypothetical protein